MILRSVERIVCGLRFCGKQSSGDEGACMMSENVFNSSMRSVSFLVTIFFPFEFLVFMRIIDSGCDSKYELS